MSRDITVDELCGVVGMPCIVVGRCDRSVVRAVPISDATPDAVTFYSKDAEDAAERIRASAAGVVVCQDGLWESRGDCGEKTLLLVAKPRLAFIRIMNHFFAPPRPEGIHPTAVVDPEAKLGEHVYVGPFTYVGRAVIGDGTVIDGHVHIYDSVRIGKNCRVQSHCVLGEGSLALERNEVGWLEEFPQCGGVALGDDVLLARGSVIDRGTFGDTVVGEGCKIDGGTVIAHNARIGPRCVVGWGVWVASVQMGAGCWVAPGACVREGLCIGAGATVGMGAVVTKDVPEGATVYGVPAREVDPPADNWQRSDGGGASG